MIIKLENIERTFNKNINVLKGVNVKFELGKFYIIMGHSGNGKSTLLNILGLLDLGYTGDYYLNNKLTKDLSLSEIVNDILNCNYLNIRYYKERINYEKRGY